LTGTPENCIEIPLGIVVRRIAGVTPWAKWSWRAVAVLPGAAPADWKVLREENDATEFHAATLPLELHRTDTEAYRTEISAKNPSVYAIMRDGEGQAPLDMVLVTASPYEAQDYGDTGEEIVEKIAMPEGLVALIRDFVDAHHEDEVFVKRRRDRKRVDLAEDGIGDARINQMSDVYRAPSSAKRRSLH